MGKVLIEDEHGNRREYDSEKLVVMFAEHEPREIVTMRDVDRVMSALSEGEALRVAMWVAQRYGAITPNKLT